jgi:branched-chain amino acid transport system permease protein
VLQQAINGLFLGSIYALFALGYTLVFGVLDILNLAHAAVFMLASYAGLALVERLHLPLPAALLCASFAAGLLGLLLERVAFRPLRGRADSNVSGLISSLAVATILEALALELFGADIARFPPDTVPEAAITLFGAQLSRLQLSILALSVLLFFALSWLMRSTRLGRELRAVAESPRAARVLGVHVDRVIASAFFLSSALGGAAGLLFSLAFNSLSPDMGHTVELKGLSVIILGGMGSMPGAVLAGFALGLLEVVVTATFGASYRDAVAFAGLFLVLVLRPRGLLGGAALREA